MDIFSWEMFNPGWTLKTPIGLSSNRFGYDAVDVMVEGKLVYRDICHGQAIDFYRELKPLGYDVLLYPTNLIIRKKTNDKYCMIDI